MCARDRGSQDRSWRWRATAPDRSRLRRTADRPAAATRIRQWQHRCRRCARASARDRGGWPADHRPDSRHCAALRWPQRIFRPRAVHLRDHDRKSTIWARAGWPPRRPREPLRRYRPASAAPPSHRAPADCPHDGSRTRRAVSWPRRPHLPHRSGGFVHSADRERRAALRSPAHTTRWPCRSARGPVPPDPNRDRAWPVSGALPAAHWRRRSR